MIGPAEQGERQEESDPVLDRPRQLFGKGVGHGMEDPDALAFLFGQKAGLGESPLVAARIVHVHCQHGSAGVDFKIVVTGAAGRLHEKLDAGVAADRVVPFGCDTSHIAVANLKKTVDSGRVILKFQGGFGDMIAAFRADAGDGHCRSGAPAGRIESAGEIGRLRRTIDDITHGNGSCQLL